MFKDGKLIYSSGGCQNCCNVCKFLNGGSTISCVAEVPNGQNCPDVDTEVECGGNTGVSHYRYTLEKNSGMTLMFSGLLVVLGIVLAVL